MLKDSEANLRTYAPLTLYVNKNIYSVLHRVKIFAQQKSEFFYFLLSEKSR